MTKCKWFGNHNKFELKKARTKIKKMLGLKGYLTCTTIYKKYKVIKHKN